MTKLTSKEHIDQVIATYETLGIHEAREYLTREVTRLDREINRLEMNDGPRNERRAINRNIERLFEYILDAEA